MLIVRENTLTRSKLNSEVLEIDWIKGRGICLQQLERLAVKLEVPRYQGRREWRQGDLMRLKKHLEESEVYNGFYIISRRAYRI